MINRIKEVITYSGLSERGFAIKCGLKPTTINNQLIGTGEISLATIIAISSSFEEISAEWLLRGTGSMLIQKEETEPGMDKLKVLDITMPNFRMKLMKRTGSYTNFRSQETKGKLVIPLSL